MIDAVIIDVVAVVVAGAGWLVLSILSVPDKNHGFLAVIGTVVFVAWSVLYFVLFWSSTDTPTPSSPESRHRSGDFLTARPGCPI